MRYPDKDRSKLFCDQCKTKFGSLYNYDIHVKSMKHRFNNTDILCKCDMSINPSQYKIHLIYTYIRNNNDKLEVEC